MPPKLSNRLLSALTHAVRAEINQWLEPVAMPVGYTLFEPGIIPKNVFFITSGMASVVAVMADGGMVEVGLVGCEGLAGCTHLLDEQATSTRCFMQVGGTALRIDLSMLRTLFRQNSELRERIMHNIRYEVLTLSQLAACNRLHGVEERLARWLLMVADLVESESLPLTQEFLSEMLGSGRPAVTISAGTLQRAGLIEYRRGAVKLLDRESLEHVACECYPLVQQLHHSLYACGTP